MNKSISNFQKHKKPESLQELFKGFDHKQYLASQGPKELDWGEPVGRELF